MLIRHPGCWGFLLTSKIWFPLTGSIFWPVQLSLWSGHMFLMHPISCPHLKTVGLENIANNLVRWILSLDLTSSASRQFSYFLIKNSIHHFPPSPLLLKQKKSSRTENAQSFSRASTSCHLYDVQAKSHMSSGSKLSNLWQFYFNLWS